LGLVPRWTQFGGAPANFACHASMLGADAFVVSQVGDDPLGTETELRYGRVLICNR
jgi:fructokinase